MKSESDIEPQFPNDVNSCNIAIIGEAPGKDEKEQGYPFVGKAGKLLDDAINDVSLNRNEMYITNVFWERPENNDVTQFFIAKTIAKKQGIEISERYNPKGTLLLKKKNESDIDRLDEELSIVEPKIIVCLGNTPLWALIGEEKISQKRGNFFNVTHLEKSKDKFVMPSWHPSAVLRDKNKYEELVSDFKKVAEYF